MRINSHQNHFRTKNKFQKILRIISSLVLALSIVVSACYLSKSLLSFKSRDRTVTVKGLSERLVKADLGIWVLNFKSSGNDLSYLEKKIAEDRKAVLNFFKIRGFQDDEIEEGGVSVVDKFANEWSGTPEKDSSNRFIINDRVTVRSNRVDLIKQSFANIGTLIKQSVIVSGEPTFHYTKFIELKQGMLVESSQNALQSAKDLISVTHGVLKGIRQAQQGSFIIRAKDLYSESLANPYDAETNESKSIEKRVKVVTTVTFNVEYD